MKIEFFVLENASRLQALRELCLLMEKSYQAAESVYIHVNSPEEAELLDRLLWTYHDESFLPHSMKAEDAAPIMIGYTTPATTSTHTLVNMTAGIPAFYQQFQRVIEMVYQDTAIQQAARERFRQYREAGQNLQTHKIKVSQA